MKKILPMLFVLAAVQAVSAGSTNIYVEDWGTGNSGVTGNGNVNTVGWTVIATSQTAGPYVGIYTATGASDPATGEALPANTLYFSVFPSGSTGAGMFYTIDSLGAGSGGNSAFTDINPTQYTNLTLYCEFRDGGANADTNYFAVQVNGSWYVATSFQFPTSGGLAYPAFTNATLVYTNPANVWNSLTIGSTDVTIGAVAAPNLTAPITGIGVVVLPTGAQPNFNQLAVQAFAPNPPPPSPPTITAQAITPQYGYAGGGASFLILASGTQPLTYIWEANGVPIPAGGRFIGVNSNMLTITNLSLADSSATYSVVVTNVAGAATNSGLALNVSAADPSVLYAETFPYVGPNGNLPLSGVGWVSSASADTVVGIYQAGPGLGDVFSYSPNATTNIYYTTGASDTGLSGLPFVNMNPANYPAITFQAGFVPGNAAGQVSGAISVYWAVAMNGVWYCSAEPADIDLSALSPYNIYQYGFNPEAANWRNLAITGSGAVIGAPASSALTGNITGAGLVIAHNTSTGSDMNFQDFEIITNEAVGTPPSIGSNIPLDAYVASGGGASFGVSASGTPPFTYGWTTNGVPVANGGRVSGANTSTVTISALSAADSGMQIVAFVTNSAGYDESDSVYLPATLTVTNAPVGFIYSEDFPFVGPVAGNYSISGAGWVEAAPNSPNALFQKTASTSDGAVFAYLGGAGTTVYYATAASDTNQSGLPFPNVNLASYPALNFSVDIAPAFSASNVAAYVAVQLNGSSWRIASAPLPVANSADSQTYSTYTMAFSPAAANWRELTVTSSGGLIGAPASGNLGGVMTGAGLVLVTVGSGGTFNFDNFYITGTGLGGINISPLSGGYTDLTWVGNPAINLQSATNLASPVWQDVPATLGAYSFPAPASGPQKFFRLVEH